ncbi:hypothetical protein [Streptomyces decoyicus]|uniref:hypothetical protein n=1 Tax=Streptomyces decoyicus TaxID=249567 RepID=UPI00386E69B7
MALLNLGAGGAAFVGPAVVSLFLGPLGPAGVVLIFAGLYVVSALLTLCLTLPDGPAAPAPPAATPVGRTALRA